MYVGRVWYEVVLCTIGMKESGYHRCGFSSASRIYAHTLEQEHTFLHGNKRILSNYPNHDYFNLSIHSDTRTCKHPVITAVKMGLFKAYCPGMCKLTDCPRQGVNVTLHPQTTAAIVHPARPSTSSSKQRPPTCGTL